MILSLKNISWSRAVSCHLILAFATLPHPTTIYANTYFAATTYSSSHRAIGSSACRLVGLSARRVVYMPIHTLAKQKSYSYNAHPDHTYTDPFMDLRHRYKFMFPHTWYSIMVVVMYRLWLHHVAMGVPAMNGLVSTYIVVLCCL